MKTLVTIDKAARDKNLLGAALGDLSTWGAWLAILKAAFALPPSKDDLAVFKDVAGGRQWPQQPVSELWVVGGRRAGKSRAAALLATYLALLVDHRARLTAGEVGHLLVISPTKSQAALIKNYVEGFLGAPMLARQIASVSAETIALTNGIEIACHAGSFRSVRGRTLVGAILDEAAFLRDEFGSALPDKELLRALLPALSTTGGMLVGISSPYRKVGVLAERHRDHFGQDGDILVIQAPTTKLNPTIKQSTIDRAMRADPEAARAEWLAEFRSDLSSYLDDALIDAAIVHARPPELPPREGLVYHAFVDMSGGRHDHSVLCVGHQEGERFVLDVLQGIAPPHDPKAVAQQFAELARSYHCRKITGDNYAGEWVAGAFKAAGIAYERSALSRSQLYLEALPHFARHAIELPDHPRLVRELRMLERQTHRSGKDSIDHPRGGSDDHANALAGCLYLTVRREVQAPTALFGTYGFPGHERPSSPFVAPPPPFVFVGQTRPRHSDAYYRIKGVTR